MTSLGNLENATGPAIVIAASDTPPSLTEGAAYICDSSGRDEQIINTVLAAGLPVKLTPGTFNLSDSIVATQSNALLEGSGRGTVLKITGVVTNRHIVSCVGTSEASKITGVTVRNLRIQGYGDDSGTTLDHGIRFKWVDGGRVENVSGINVTFSVVALEQCTSCIVSAITADVGSLGTHGGWYCVSANNQGSTSKFGGHVFSNLVSNVPEHAISLTHTDHCTATGIVSNNNNTDYVVNIQGCEYVEVSNVTAKLAGGLFFAEPWSSRPCQYLTFANASMTKASTGGATGIYGVYATTSSFTTIQNVKLLMTNQTAGHGIRIDALSDDCKVRGCTVIGAFGEGIYAENDGSGNAADRFEISGNTVKSCGQNGIRTGNGLYGVIVGNHCIGNGANGIILQGPYMNVTGNTCQGNTSDGIEAQFADDAIIASNICTGNTGYGINVSASNADRTIIGVNQTRGNTAGTVNDSGTSTVTVTVP